MPRNALKREFFLVTSALILVGAALALPLIHAEIRLAPPSKGGGTPPPSVIGHIPAVTPAAWPPNPSPKRILVALNTPITDGIITQLASYGVVHGWIDRYRLVAMTPKGGDPSSIAALSFVSAVDADRPVYLTDVGTWDRDIIDVTDVEESGVIGDPDRREVQQTGAGVHVAVIDTGLSRNWRDFLIESRVDTSLARAFMGGGAVLDNTPVNEFNTSNPTDLWEGDTIGHGTATASHVIGFKIGPFVVDGAAPGARVVPLKIFSNGSVAFTSQVVAAIDYVSGLVRSGTIGPTVINMSFSAPEPNAFEEQAINGAIAAGIVLVASAANRGEAGMGWPGAYPQVISVGAVGWTKQFRPGTLASPNFDFWWTQDVGFDPDPRRGPAEESEAGVFEFSSRAIPGLVPGFTQELDLLAPGVNTVAPFPNAQFQFSGFFFVSGTSFSSPLTAGATALMLEKNPTLTQSQVEAILKSTAHPMNPVDSRPGLLRIFDGCECPVSWDDDCSGLPCDPVGAGLLDADGALAATPRH